jgi:hypothetical protein
MEVRALATAAPPYLGDSVFTHGQWALHRTCASVAVSDRDAHNTC